MVIVLGKSDNIALRRDLQSAAATNFDIGTLKLSNEWAISLEHCHVESVPMTISNQNVTGIANVDSIGVVCQVLTANASQEMTLFIEHYHTMALQIKQLL